MVVANEDVLLTFACEDVTRVGNVGYFSCINFRRYSVACDEPHGILQPKLSKLHPKASAQKTYRFALLRMPLPFRMGITDVDAVLNEIISPSAENCP